MSDPGPLGPEGDDPFRGIPLFGDLARMLQQQGPVNWDAARQLAASIATEGASEPNVDPLDRIQLEQLARVAELQVANATSLTTSPSGRGVSIVPVTRTVWMQKTLDAHRQLFEALAGSLSGTQQMPTLSDDPEDLDDPMAKMLGGIMQAFSPVMLGMTIGSLLGHLARRSFGQYDLPIPRPPSDEIAFLLGNIDDFGNEWSLPKDDLRLWVCVHEVTRHAVLSVPHVRSTLDSLLHRYVAGFEPDPNALETRLGELDVSDPNALTKLPELLGDPEVLLGAIQSPAQRELLPQLEAIVAVVVGYVDYVMDSVGEGLVGSYGMVTEALRRRRVTADPSDRFVERLFGLELTQAHYEHGAAFVHGVVERSGADALERLWKSERELPTPAEIDAPGLWLARIDLPESG
ncbi:MAG TPA: zinc-dependent metalloprotease [Acidimicrobiales bacterium]